MINDQPPITDAEIEELIADCNRSPLSFYDRSPPGRMWRNLHRALLELRQRRAAEEPRR